MGATQNTDATLVTGGVKSTPAFLSLNPGHTLVNSAIQAVTGSPCPVNCAMPEQ
jgi:hypothetical protein